ncbi:MAG: D-alanyl-D-alanine carboxypeptidase family protein [Christensenellales bacterium]|jgi:D-alanyl-D-alanine carboxypeptidase (penicillin-binding protein 5/6)
MHRRVRAFSLLLLILLFVTAVLPAHASTPQDWDPEHPEQLEPGHLFAEAVLVIDEETGTVLFSKNADTRMFPASTTKILTLALAIESGISLDSMVTIPKEVESMPEGSSYVPVYAGEEMSFRDLLYGLMLRSGNDAAIAVAVLVSGSVSEFAALMNRRAMELGCTSSHFTNPHGYHDDNHYTTATDMAIITRYAMSLDLVREISATREYTMAATGRRGKLVIQSKVDLIDPDSPYYVEECVGIKTGFHSRAGQCLVSAAEKGGRRIISVAFRASVDYPTWKWYDAARIFAYGFTRYDTYRVRELFAMAGEGIQSIQVENSAKDDLYAGNLPLILSQTSDDGYAVIALKDTDEAAGFADYFREHATVTVTTDYLEKLENRMTIEAGSIVGTLSFDGAGGEPIMGTLIASRSVALEPLKLSAWEYLTENIPWLESLRDERVVYLSIGFLVLFAFIIIAGIVRNVRRNRRRKRIYEQRRRAYLAQQRRQERPPVRRSGATRRPRYDDF